MTTPDHFEFVCPVKTNAGHRALDHLPFELSALNAVKPLLITTPEISARGLVDIVTNAFRDSGLAVGIFDGVPPSPDILLIRELAGIYRARGFDAIVALGGGAVADTAKVLNIVVSGKPEDLETSAGEDRVAEPLLPLAAILTSRADGDETSRYAVLGDRFFSSPRLMPNLAVIDPRMMVSEKADITAAAAMKALVRSIEATRWTGKNPLVDAYAHAAMQLIMENLMKVIGNAGDRKGRLALANAACFAGCAFSNAPSGMIQELGTAAALACKGSPGQLMGVLLPHGIEAYRRNGGAHIASWLFPLAGFEADAMTPDTEKADKVLRMVDGLIAALADAGAAPRTIAQTGLPKEALKELARTAAEKGFPEADCLAVLEGAWNGMDRTGVA